LWADASICGTDIQVTDSFQWSIYRLCHARETSDAPTALGKVSEAAAERERKRERERGGGDLCPDATPVASPLWISHTSFPTIPF